jgi:hypothetical protein
MNAPLDRKKVPAVVLVRDAFVDIYAPSLTRKIVSFQFPMDVYSSMEIVNADACIRLINDFFVTNGLPPLALCLIIQSPILKKDFPMVPTQQLEANIQSYLDYVPFDTVVSKRLKSEKGVQIIAANGDFIDILKTAFAQVGCSVECVTPLEGLSFMPKGGVSALTESIGAAVLKNEAQVKQEAFQVAVQKEADEFEVVDVLDKPMQPASQLPLLLGIFGILLVVLVAVYINMGKDFGLTPRPVTRKTIVPTIPPKPSPAVKGVFTSTFPQIKIIATQGQFAYARAIASRLMTEGYADVTISATLQESNPRTIAMIPTSLSAKQTDRIKTLLRKLVPHIVFESISGAQSPILFVVGN